MAALPVTSAGGFQGVAPGPQSGTIPVTGGGTAAQPNPFTGNSAAVTNAYNTALQDPRNTAGNMQSSYATSAALNAMTPAERQAYQSRWMGQNTGGFWNTLNTQVLPAVLLAAASGGLGAGVGAAASGTLGATGGAVAGGAAGGAVGAVGGSIINDTPLTLGAVGKGALVGGVTGALGSLAKPAAGALSSSTGLSQGASNALVKGGIGAIGSAVSGGNPLAGAASGVAGSLASSGAGSLGAAPGVASAVGKVAGGIASGAVNSPPKNSNVSNGVNAGLGALGTAGAIAGGNNMAASPLPVNTNGASGATGTGLGIGNSLLGSVGGLIGAAGGIQQGNANGNVLSNTQNAAGIGTNTSYTGPNSTAAINNGQVQTGLTGGLNTANQNLGTLGAQQSQIAASFGNAAPTNVQNAINSQAGQQAPQGTQGALNAQGQLQTAVQGSQLGLIGAGQQQLGNSLTGNLQNAAQNQLSTAGSDFNTTYNNQLNSLNAQLALPAAQAQSQLNDQEFGRGQLGTSGGALQTQAFATGLGQAFMGNQNQAFNQAMSAQNSATSNAATLSGAANNNLSTANSLLANAYGQFNNTSALNTNTANSIFNQNSQISQLGNQYGQQNLNNQITSAALPAQLAGAYGANANQAISGATGLNNIAAGGATQALAAGTQQGNQANNALANAAHIVGPGATTNGLTGIGSALNGIGGTNLLGGIGSAFGALTGGGGGSTAGGGNVQTDYGQYATTGDNSIGSEMGDLSGYYSDPSYDQLDFGP